MFVVNEDKSVYVTRGDVCEIPVQHQFNAGDIVRIKITKKKDCESVVMQRDFDIQDETDSFVIFLTGDDTKLGEVISKPTDYWYEIELNPDTHPETIVGYDEDGAKIFRLYPEGKDVDGEDIEVVGHKTLQELVDYALETAKESGAFDGEKGEKGNPGEKGEKGDQGDTGDTGDSAYEIAVKHGFGGTEEEWLASLKSNETVYISDANSINENGVYKCDVNTADNERGTIIHMNYSPSTAYQKYITEDAKYTAERGKSENWREWEWVNPPMLFGVEYRTTERYNGKPVYMKAVKLEGGPNNGEKKVNHGARNAIVFDVGGVAVYGNSCLSLPWLNYITISASQAEVVVAASANYSGYDLHTWIKYYKTTD